ncbi:MAG: N-acetyltransferase [Pseudomonadota bacterium]|nr:N-acetyltransferase [Pseudomonadota bacterium]
MIVREEIPADATEIRAIHMAAFPGLAEAALVDRLRAEGDAVISLVISLDGVLVGHILFSKMIAPFRALALAPVAVMPPFQRRGFGHRLVERGLALASEAGWEGVFVLGDPQYYRRFGFRRGTALRFSSPYSGPAFMGLSLIGANLPVSEGELRHPPAFDWVG